MAELDQLMALGKKAGNTAMVARYQAVREYKVQAAHQKVQSLERQLDAEIDKLTAIRLQQAEQTALAETITAQLEEADGAHKGHHAQLHTTVVGAKEQQVACQVPLAKLLQGDVSCVDLSDCDALSGIEDVHGVADDERENFEAPKEQLAGGITKLATQLFGEVQQTAERLKAKHQKHKGRLSEKKRKTDGEQSAADGSPADPSATDGGHGAAVPGTPARDGSQPAAAASPATDVRHRAAALLAENGEGAAGRGKGSGAG
ncbi:unnamed protein product, partial [Prorocentrum cordatum]